MNPLILNSVSKTFGGVNAVSGISLQMEPGMITGLIGPNGAGKTTVINLITGLLPLSDGAICLGDRDITSWTPEAIARAGVARTFQTIRLLKESSVLDNVIAGLVRTSDAGLMANILSLPLARREQDLWRRRALSLLENFGMRSYAEYPAGRLSYGHQRRVEVARSLAANPSWVLLDEPAAGMNDVEADELGQFFRRLADGGLGFLLVEHNMRLVMSLCDQVHVLDSGHLIASGTPAEVASNPTVIAAYLGKP
jgi:branched-chain amino acid transport system ATP-binding protein